MNPFLFDDSPIFFFFLLLAQFIIVPLASIFIIFFCAKANCKVEDTRIHWEHFYNKRKYVHGKIKENYNKTESIKKEGRNQGKTFFCLFLFLLLLSVFLFSCFVFRLSLAQRKAFNKFRTKRSFLFFSCPLLIA